MTLVREVTCIRKRSDYFDPHEIIESLGGEYLGWPWRLPDYMVIHYIKTGVENYYVQMGKKRLKIIIAVYETKEYLKTETDGYSPDTLLALPICDLLKVLK
jgi:hypothetical protein